VPVHFFPYVYSLNLLMYYLKRQNRMKTVIGVKKSWMSRKIFNDALLRDAVRLPPRLTQTVKTQLTVR
jgi:hypothetical protein